MTRQGRTARASSYAETLQLCKVIRRHQDSDAMHDLLLALCEWFPSGRSHGRGRTGPARTLLGDQWACPACSEPGDETCSHVLMCEAFAPARWNLTCRIDDLLKEGLSVSLCDAVLQPVALMHLVDLVASCDRTRGSRAISNLLLRSQVRRPLSSPCVGKDSGGPPPCPAPRYLPVLLVQPSPAGVFALGQLSSPR